MKVINQLDDKHIEELHTLYQYEWWTRGRSLDETRRCIAGSQICVGIVDDSDRLQAFARILTDYTFKALVFDVIVSESQRGTGLGNRLLSLIRNHDELKHVDHFELYCLPDMIPFYERHGFSTNVGEIRLMRLTTRAGTA